MLIPQELQLSHASALSYDVHFESKGFIEAVSITGFPIRDPIRFVLIPF